MGRIRSFQLYCAHWHGWLPCLRMGAITQQSLAQLWNKSLVPKIFLSWRSVSLLIENPITMTRRTLGALFTQVLVLVTILNWRTPGGAQRKPSRLELWCLEALRHCSFGLPHVSCFHRVRGGGRAIKFSSPSYVNVWRSCGMEQECAEKMEIVAVYSMEAELTYARPSSGLFRQS